MSLLPFNIMKSWNLNFLRILLLGVLLSSPLVGWAKQSRVMKLTEAQLLQGTYDRVFVDTNAMLQLIPEYTKLADLEANIIWDAVSWVHPNRVEPDLWVGGGTNGFLTALNTELTPIFTTNFPYPEITALAATGAIAETPARLFVANGPNGALYQLTPGDDATAAEPYQFTKLASFAEPFIWDLYFHAEQETLYIATGGASQGSIYKLTFAKANEEQSPPVKLFSVAEANVLNLMIYKDYVLATSSPHGKLYSYHQTEETLQVLYDSFQGDITDVVMTPDSDSLYLAVTQATGANGTIASGQSASPSASINPCGPQSAASPSRKKRAPCQKVSASDIYELTLAEDRAEQRLAGVIRKLYITEQGTIAKLMIQNHPRRLIYGTIENNTIRALNVQTLESELLHEQKDVTLAEMVYFAENIYFISLDPSSIFKLSSSASGTGIFTSSVFPLNETVQWGRFVLDQYSQARLVTVETRTGNTQTLPPTAASGWSEWEELSSDEKIASPPGSFMQFRLTLKPSGNTSPRIHNIRFYYTALNTAPELSPLTITYQPNENHAPQRAPQRGQNTAPNPLDFLNNLNEYTRQYRLSWNVLKNDGDILRYTLAIRSLSDSKQEWRVLAKDFFTNFFLIDNRKFPDGRYQFKLTYDDFLSNGRTQGFVREELSPYHIIDNTPPAITDFHRSDANLTFKVRDNLSRVSRVFYSFDRNHHYELSPEDGVNDSREETFTLPLPKVEENDQLATFLIIAVDGVGNIQFAYP